MTILTLPVGPLETNCFLVYLEEKKQLYIIDPGGDAEEIAETAKKFPFVHAAVLLTHAHFDHISGLGELKKLVKLDFVCLADEDKTFYNSPENCYPPFIPPAKDLPATVSAADTDDFAVIPLPGHTPGGRGFLFGNALFSGDTLFAGSVGRTDFPGGNSRTLMKSIREQLMTLPDNIDVYSGHGPASTIGRERRGNPFIKGEII